MHFLETDEIRKLSTRPVGHCPNKGLNFPQLIGGIFAEPLNEPLTKHTASKFLHEDGVEWEGVDSGSKTVGISGDQHRVAMGQAAVFCNASIPPGH